MVAGMAEFEEVEFEVDIFHHFAGTVERAVGFGTVVFRTVVVIVVVVLDSAVVVSALEVEFGIESVDAEVDI